MKKKKSDFQEVGRRCGSLMFRQLDFSLLASPFGRRVKSLDRGQWSTWMVEQLHRLSSSLVELFFSPSLPARPSRSAVDQDVGSEELVNAAAAAGCTYQMQISSPAACLIFSTLSTHAELLCGEKMKRDTLGVFFNLWSRCDAATETGNNKRPRWFWSSTGPDLGGRAR